MWKLTWPLVAWALLVVVLYSVSYSKFSAVDSALRSVKMGERSAAQAARLEYLVTELVLSRVRGWLLDGRGRVLLDHGRRPALRAELA